MERKFIARPLGKDEIEECCECGEQASHEVDSKIKNKKVFTCTKKACMGRHLYGS